MACDASTSAPDLPSLLLVPELPLFLYGLLHRGGPVLGVVVPPVPCDRRADRTDRYVRLSRPPVATDAFPVLKQLTELPSCPSVIGQA